MAISSIGYDGSVDELPWAKLGPMLGTEYGVVDPTHWRAVAKTGADRTVQISAGTGWGPGVVDVSDAVVEKQFDVQPTAGTRYDMLVARRNWGSNTTSFEIIKGSSNQNTLPARNQNAGVLDDQPLSLWAITFGSTVPVQVADLRVVSHHGGASITDARALQYLTGRSGGSYRQGNTVWSRRLNATATAAEWIRRDDPFWRGQKSLAARSWSGLGEMMGVYIPDAPPGSYLIHGTASITSLEGVRSLRPHMLVNGSIIGDPVPDDLVAGVTQAKSLTLPHEYAGGNMTVQYVAQADGYTPQVVFARLDVYFLGNSR